MLDDIHAQVERILQASAPPAQIEVVAALPGNNWGAYDPATHTVKISAAAPESCRPLIAAHELAHHIAVMGGLLDGVPTEDIRDELERLASVVEERFEPWSPNCIGVR